MVSLNELGHWKIKHLNKKEMGLQRGGMAGGVNFSSEGDKHRRKATPPAFQENIG
jgi:hypothetical protein